MAVGRDLPPTQIVCGFRRRGAIQNGGEFPAASVQLYRLRANARDPSEAPPKSGVHSAYDGV